MNYDLQLLPEAIEDLAYWKRSGQKKVLKKIVALLEELKVLHKPAKSPLRASGLPVPVWGAL